MINPFTFLRAQRGLLGNLSLIRDSVYGFTALESTTCEEAKAFDTGSLYLYVPVFTHSICQ